MSPISLLQISPLNLTQLIHYSFNQLLADHNVCVSCETRCCYSHKSLIRTRLRFQNQNGIKTLHDESQISKIPLRLQSMATCSLWASPSFSPRRRFCSFSHSRPQSLSSVFTFGKERVSRRVFCSYEDNDRDRPQSTGIQVYGEIERYATVVIDMRK